MYPDLHELQEIVVSAAREELLPRCAKTSHSRKLDGSLVTEADIAMQRRVGETLMTRWPEYEFLGEELSATDQTRLLNTPDKGLWCLDPLDGTSNFTAGIPYFATSLALLVSLCLLVEKPFWVWFTIHKEMSASLRRRVKGHG